MSMWLDDAMQGVPADWAHLLDAWRQSVQGRELLRRLQSRSMAGAAIFPRDPFFVLKVLPLGGVRAVIVGQDPYHGVGQAHGLAFSVPSGVRIPPSLRNIFAERERDLGLAAPASGDLTDWARRGVLLLNAVLTVEEGAPASHSGWGWEALTDAVLAATAEQNRPIAFLLWGAHAQRKRALIEAVGGGRHHILQANHPSPLAARRGPHPFIGCGHFKATRDALGLDWGLPGDAPLAMTPGVRLH